MWLEIGKLVGAPLAGAALEHAKDARKSWLDDQQATKAIQLLYHQVVLDDHGNVPDDRRQFQADQLLFTNTLVRAEELFKGSLYVIEAVNSALALTEPKRVRFFAYQPATNEFRLEKPTDTFVFRHPRGHWTVQANNRDQQRDHPNADRNWFIQPMAPQDVLRPVHFIPFALSAKTFKDSLQNARAMARVRDALRRDLLDQRNQVRQDRLVYKTDNLAFRLLPLQTAQGRKVLYLVFVTNTTLSASHPIRTMAAIYSAAANEILWL